MNFFTKSKENKKSNIFKNIFDRLDPSNNAVGNWYDDETTPTHIQLTMEKDDDKKKDDAKKKKLIEKLSESNRWSLLNTVECPNTEVKYYFKLYNPRDLKNVLKELKRENVITDYKIADFQNPNSKDEMPSAYYDIQYSDQTDTKFEVSFYDHLKFYKPIVIKTRIDKKDERPLLYLYPDPIECNKNVDYGLYEENNHGEREEDRTIITITIPDLMNKYKDKDICEDELHYICAYIREKNQRLNQTIEVKWCKWSSNYPTNKLKALLIKNLYSYPHMYVRSKEYLDNSHNYLDNNNNNK
jgi:hypothetical protein